MSAEKCHGGCSHYEVVSPEMVSYGWMEPPEPYRCWGFYLAKNAAAARVAAVKDPEFSDWVREARGDKVPPFKDLTVRLARCEHGVCWGCHATEDSSGCPTCEAESEAHFLAAFGPSPEAIEEGAE